MTDMLIDTVTAALSQARIDYPVGRVTGATGGVVAAGGLVRRARLGDRALICHGPVPQRAEVIRIDSEQVMLLPEGVADGVSIGDTVLLVPPTSFAPDDGWIGRVIDPDGQPLDGRPLLPGPLARPIRAEAPPAHGRRALGSRLSTGHAIFDTLLPLARGQRIGLFAGSGVGKSTLLAGLARAVAADVIVIGLVGERGRELRHFIEDVLGPDGMRRSVIVAATSDRAPQVRRRCALSATAVAEHFRDQGRQVLLLIDSVTRFAEAHRELAVAAGEPAGLRGFPATTASQIAALCERAGPGFGEAGDITAVYSVLVSGSDMEEPVADMLRGVLDGHVVMDRSIAERGRFPAIDVLRSVSRSLPGVATKAENAVIAEARGHLAAYDRAALLIRAGLYVAGSDAEVDAAVACHPALEKFLARTGQPTVQSSFDALRQALATARNPGRIKP